MQLTRRTITKKLSIYSFILPGTLLIAAMVLYPLLYAFYMSFTTKEGMDTFFSLSNYSRVIGATHFFEMLKNTILWVISTVILSFLLGFGVAALIEQDFVKRKNIWRSIILLAWITPGVVKAEAWKWLYSYDFGMLNHTLVSLKIIKEPVSWLITPDSAFLAVVLIQVWGMFPYVMLMISAGMQSINKEYHDCALLDGASWFRYIRSIVVPIISDVVFIALLIITIWSINTFVVIWLVTQGGPLGSTTVLSLDIYQKFLMFDLRGASATAILQLIISLSITILYVQRSRREEAA